MKLRFVGSLFAALLLVGTLASATPALDLSAVFSASTEAPGECAKGALSFMTPSPIEKTDHPTCGACSVAICVGAYDGTPCGTAPGGQYKYCRPSTTLCQDGPPADLRCTCTTGITP